MEWSAESTVSRSLRCSTPLPTTTRGFLARASTAAKGVPPLSDGQEGGGVVPEVGDGEGEVQRRAHARHLHPTALHSDTVTP